MLCFKDLYCALMNYTRSNKEVNVQTSSSLMNIRFLNFSAIYNVFQEDYSNVSIHSLLGVSQALSSVPEDGSVEL